MKEIRKKSIKFITENSLCVGCSICSDVCPNNAITIIKKKGLFVPIINENLCETEYGCNLCYRICPGKGIYLREKAINLYSKEAKWNYYIGRYLKIYSGYSANKKIRYHSSSGGIITQLITYLFENRLINGALVVRFVNNNPLQPKVIIAKSKEELYEARGSKYSPVYFEHICSKIKKSKGKYVIVGLPCHIHGFRNYEEKDENFKKKIFGYISLYCSSLRSFYAIESLLNSLKLNPKDITFFSYRDDGCLGNLIIITKNKKISIPYKKYYWIWKSFFKPQRCLFCIDHFGNLSDISVGDLQVGKYKKDRIGINSIIIRSQKFLKLFRLAKKEKTIIASSLKPDILIKSQNKMLRHKRKLAGLNIFLDKKNILPKYDIPLPTDYCIFDYIIFLLIKVQRILGRNKYFLKIYEKFTIFFFKKSSIEISYL